MRNLIECVENCGFLQIIFVKTSYHWVQDDVVPVPEVIKFVKPLNSLNRIKNNRFLETLFVLYLFFFVILLRA